MARFVKRNLRLTNVILSEAKNLKRDNEKIYFYESRKRLFKKRFFVVTLLRMTVRLDSLEVLLWYALVTIGMKF